MFAMGAEKVVLFIVWTEPRRRAGHGRESKTHERRKFAGRSDSQSAFSSGDSSTTARSPRATQLAIELGRIT